MNRALAIALALIVFAPLAYAGDAPAPVQGDDPGADVPHYWIYSWPKTDFTRHSVSYKQFLSGGVGKDGIPPIYEPAFVAAEDAGATPGLEDMGPNEPVIVVELAGETRAYPVRVLMWREIVNDAIGGVPVAITFCPLCNAAVAFDRRVRGETTLFGVTGLLRNSDLVMWDHHGEGWWQQFTGECLVGWCVGERLRLIPTRMEPWRAFLARAPQGKTLTPGTDVRRRWGTNPYAGYDARANHPFLYAGPLPEGLPAMARVVSLGARGALTLALLRELGEARLADGTTLRWRAGLNSALDTEHIVEGRDVGAVEALDAQGEPALHDVVFAFVQHAFYPQAPIITTAGSLARLDP